MIGILILDISCLPLDAVSVVTAEVVGFAVLICATMIEYAFPEENMGALSVEIRYDMIHVTEAAGLVLLTFVATAHYRARVWGKQPYITENMTVIRT